MKTFVATLSFLSFSLASAGVQAQAANDAGSASPLVLRATIPLPGAKGRMDHMSVDVKGKRVFLSEIGNGAVEAIDCITRKILHFTGFGEPQGNYFDAVTNRLFVASGDDGTVKIFNGSTYAPVATAKFTTDADNLRYDPQTRPKSAKKCAVARSTCGCVT